MVMPEIRTTAELLRKRGLMTMRLRLFRPHADGHLLFTLELSLSLCYCERARVAAVSLLLSLSPSRGREASVLVVDVVVPLRRGACFVGVGVLDSSRAH